MLSKQDLRRQLAGLAARATAIGEALANGEDVLGIELAEAVVTADRLTRKLDKLADQLNGKAKEKARKKK
jgi:hypothetical protein